MTSPSGNSSLDLFHPLVQRWFLERVGNPTDIQSQAWPEIAKGNHVLVTAPTGSGKTLTAFLWAINDLLTHPPQEPGLQVLYISPLKALNNDIQRNLELPLQELRLYFQEQGQSFPDIRIAVRSGDTDPAERRQMLRHPPQILITTPESLNVLLTSPNGQRLFTRLKTVILDEIHAVLPNKRGTYLITAIERLVSLSGEFQRIALSATTKPLEITAAFVAGFRLLRSGKDFFYEKRPVTIIGSKIHKKYEICVDFPEVRGSERQPDREVWWPSLTASLRQVIAANQSTLLFANSRRMVEKITRYINEQEGPVAYSHHGSLSREIRAVVEKRFKEGELSAIIATSSLELGIDIGSVDQVVLIQAPFAIASAIQRIGRSGHGVGQTSRGIFFPIHSSDLITAAVLAAHIDSEAIEPIIPMDAPLDVLAQVILSMSVHEPRDIDQLYRELRCSYPYHDLSRKEFDLVLQMLAGRYADSRLRELKPRLLLDRVKNTVKARDNAPMLLYLSGGVIPDRGYYNMRLADTKAKIGELDEEFVWERTLGDAFPFGNQIWRILRITHNDVEVAPVPQSNSLVPFWKADEMNRSFHLSEKILTFLEIADEGLNVPEFKQVLQRDHHLSERAVAELILYLKRQKEESKAPLPHRHHLLIEHFHDPVNRSDCKQTVLHTLWGGKVNRPLAFALAAAWEEKYHYPLNIFANNDCILLNLPHAFNSSDILALVQPQQLRHWLRAGLESTAYFGALFRENAQRALLLPRQHFNQRVPLWLNRLRSKKVLEAVAQYEDFPVLLETWRQCLNHEFDIEALLNLLAELQGGEIVINEVVTSKPSPFADSIIWRQTNQYMYEDDSPYAKLQTNLSDALLKEVMYASQLRPRFADSLLSAFQEKIQRTAPGYAPSSAEELLQWTRERLFLPYREWQGLLAAIARDHGLTHSDLLPPIADRLYFLKDHRLEAGEPKTERTGEPGTAAGYLGVMALENVPRIGQALGWDLAGTGQTAQQLGLTPLFSQEAQETLEGFLQEWLGFYGPVSPA